MKYLEDNYFIMYFINIDLSSLLFYSIFPNTEGSEEVWCEAAGQEKSQTLAERDIFLSSSG